jgi:hypothetical protein
VIFDGAFHVPSWCRDLKIEPEHLIKHCQREEGVQNTPSAGALALAKWLLDDIDRADREKARPGSPLSMGGVINRLLAGVITPSQQLAESLGHLTGGAVTLEMFDRPGTGAAMAAAILPDDPPPPMASPIRVYPARDLVEIEAGDFTLRTTIAAASLLGKRLVAALGT